MAIRSGTDGVRRVSVGEAVPGRRAPSATLV